MRAFPRAQPVVSTVICWCSQTPSVGGNFGVKQGGFFAEQALQPAHEPYRHIGTLPRSSGVAVAERVFPRLMESLVPECWRNAIVAGRCRKSSTSFVAGCLVSHGANLPDTSRQACAIWRDGRLNCGLCSPTWPPLRLRCYPVRRCGWC